MAATDKSKNTDIECLRAIAIILVMMQHYRNRLPTPHFYYQMFDYIQPWTGVDLFLAISGYLVCKTLLEHLKREPSAVALPNFWRRRTVRLLPAFVFWAAISVCVASAVADVPTQGFVDSAKGAIVGLIGIANLYWTLCAKHGFTCVHHDYNSHFWSLALEWQLYVLLAASIALLSKRLAFLALAICAIVASCFHAPSFSWAWSLRPQAFVLGSLIYVSSQHDLGSKVISFMGNTSLKRIILAVGVAIVVVAPAAANEPFVIPLVGIGAAIALFSAILSGETYPTFLSALLQWIGARSYSIYLCHLSVIYALQKALIVKTDFTGPSSSYLFGIAWVCYLSLTMMAADLSYRFIERPALRRFSSSRVIPRETS